MSSSYTMNAMTAAASCDEPRVLVTVAQTAGSAPREPGAKMLITAQEAYDTIGGGHLEMVATEIAREMLAMPVGELRAQRRLERYALGPSLGQCCGGVVWLLFEPVSGALEDVMVLLRQRRKEDSCRITAIDGEAECRLVDEQHKETHIQTDADGRRWLVDPVKAPRAHLVLFGAGHVGAAIVRALAELPCHVVWVDEREDMFPDRIPANVRVEATDTPEAVVAEAPAGASFLVMTHNHALDQMLSEHILRRTDFTWFGLIGSKTKRVSFERRLQERGIPAARLADMTCPVGVPGIQGKEPAVIAIAVAAQLLQVWEAAAAAPSLSGSAGAGARLPTSVA